MKDERKKSEKEAHIYDLLWVIGDVCYYLGLVSGLLFIPALTLILWIMSLVDRAHPNYWYILIAWFVAVLVFFSGIGLKNIVYKTKEQ